MLGTLINRIKYKEPDQVSYHDTFALLIIHLTFTLKKRERFYEQLAVMLKADIALYNALEAILKKYIAKNGLFHRYSVEIKVLQDCLYRLDEGLGAKGLGEILVGLIPQSELIILSIGNTNMVSALEQVLQMRGQLNKVRTDIMQMMVTPVMSIIAVLGIVLVLSPYIFKVLLTVFPLKKLPAVTQSYYHFYHFCQSEILPLSIIVISFALLIYFSLGRYTGRLRRWLDYCLPYNLYKQLQSTSFLISLSLMLGASSDFTSAIASLKQHANAYLTHYLTRIEHQLHEGDSPGQALTHIQFFKTDIEIYIDIFDISHQLSKGLSTMSDKILASQMKSIRALMGIVSALLIIVAAVVLMWFYLAVNSIGFATSI